MSKQNLAAFQAQPLSLTDHLKGIPAPAFQASIPEKYRCKLFCSKGTIQFPDFCQVKQHFLKFSFFVLQKKAPVRVFKDDVREIAAAAGACVSPHEAFDPLQALIPGESLVRAARLAEA